MESPVSNPLYLNIAMIRLFVYGQFTSREAGPLPSWHLLSQLHIGIDGAEADSYPEYAVL